MKKSEIYQKTMKIVLGASENMEPDEVIEILEILIEERNLAKWSEDRDALEHGGDQE